MTGIRVSGRSRVEFTEGHALGGELLAFEEHCSQVILILRHVSVVILSQRSKIRELSFRRRNFVLFANSH